MKRNPLVFVLLTALTLTSVVPLLLVSFYPGQDAISHLIKVIKFAESLQEGQFPVRWAGTLAFGLGSPIFSFNFILPFAAASMLYVVGLSAVASYKIVLICATVLSGAWMYVWLSKRYHQNASILGACVWMWAPYRFLNLYHRSAIGEVVATLFIPWMLWAVDAIRTPSYRFGLLALPIAGLILSHNVMALLGSIILISYLAASRFPARLLYRPITEYTVALGLSAFFWMPAFFERASISISGLLQHTYLDNFVPFVALVYSKWEGGTIAAGKVLSASFQLGVVHWFILMAAIAFVYRHKQSPLFLWGLVLTLASLFLSNELSTPFYQMIPFLPVVLYPSRFIGIALLGIAVVAVNLFESGKSLPIAFLVTLLILASRNHLILVNTPVNEESLKGIVSYTADMGGEFLPREMIAQNAFSHPLYPTQPSILKATHNTQITLLDTRGTLITGLITAREPADVVVNKFYWPGWIAYVDGQRYQLKSDPDIGGRMKLSVPSGSHSIKIVLEDTPIRKIANILSLSFLITFIAVKLKRILVKC